jgi:hypothetical protein
VECYFDVQDLSLNKKGEELCGDKVKRLTSDDRVIVVLSDGLGSGVKANILATLTSEIIITMLNADVSLENVIETVIGTLPICKVRNIAYATFTILQIDKRTGAFKVINCDNPPIFLLKRGRVSQPETQTVTILGKTITVIEGTLSQGDFLGAITDGVLYAGMGVALNYGWGWQSIAKHLEGLFVTRSRTARGIVQDVITKTHSLYNGEIGDDATCVGVYVRERRGLMIFTGPPLEPSSDTQHAEELLNFEGRRVVCGGTTGSIVAEYLGETIDTDIATLRREVPPIGLLRGIDLLTEGIITMSKALEYLRESDGDERKLPKDRNGAQLLATEILKADFIHLLVGQRINEFYQNPLLPKTISIRKNLVRELEATMRDLHKEVAVEYC